MSAVVESAMLSAVDQEAFARDIRALRQEVDAAIGPDDLEHMYKVERWGKMATAAGLLTCWIAPNPISAACLAYGRGTRWIMMHHISHRGYDHVPGVPERYTSKVFARGWRRWVDWPDWMVPEAWIYEHNVLHHSHTGHDEDPDLIERNTSFVHDWPPALRWTFFGLLALTWRSSYYAPSTEQEFLARHGDRPTYWQIIKSTIPHCWLPAGAYFFVGLPLLFAPLGPWAVASTLANSVAAEALTNVHTFSVVGPNHAGDDLYRFEDKPTSKAERLVRQVLASTNFSTGTNFIDCAHLWLNYQIEHHLFPDLPMLQYQRIQPKVREICERHGLPYVQENVFRRVAKMAQNLVGNTKMKVWGKERDAGHAEAHLTAAATS